MLGDDPDDDNGHGNRMIREMRSVDPNVQILSVKALDADGKGTASSIYAAIEYAISQDVKIINLSVSAYVRADNACIREVIEKAADRGIIVVGAAGNAGKNVRYYIPGNIEAALIAGACDENGKRLSSSNYGETVDCLVAAPSTSEASAKLSAWISGRPDEVSWKEALEQETGRNGLIFPADQAVSGSASEKETQEDSALDEGQTMQDEEESIMISDWPVYKDEWNFEEDEKAIETIKEAVRGIRNVRTQMNVAPSRKALVYVVSDKDDVLDIFRKGKLFFESLAYASESVCQNDKSGIADDAVSVVLADATCYIPFSDLVDISAEIERLSKEQKKLEGELKRSQSMLSNEKFLSKAPAEKIAEEKEKQQKYQQTYDQITERLAQLKG